MIKNLLQNHREKLEEICKEGGKNRQLIVVMEELAELTQAIAKHNRRENSENIKNELADVIITLSELIIVMGFEESEVEELVEKKYKRLIDRYEKYGMNF